MATAPHHNHPDPPAPGSATIPPASSTPDHSTPDPHQQALNDAWQSAAQADHHAQLNARLKNIEPLLDIIEQSERMMRHMAREDVSYLPPAILDHHDQLTTIAHRCLAMRKTLYQLHNANPTPGSAGVPPAIKNAPSDCSAGAPAGLSNCSAGAPAGHSDKGTNSTPTNTTTPSPSRAPQGRRAVATGEAMQRNAQPVEPIPNSFRAPEGHRNTPHPPQLPTPNPSAPSAIPNSSFLIHNSPQRTAPIPPIPPLPKGFTDPNPSNPHTPLNYPTPRTEADIDHLMQTLDTLRTANLTPNPASRSAASTPSVASVASVPTIRSIPTIPLTKIQATARKLYNDVLTLTRNHPNPTPANPNPASPDPNSPISNFKSQISDPIPDHPQSAQITHTPDTIPQTTIQNLTTPTPHNATPNPVTGVSRPTAGHTTVTEARHRRKQHPTQPQAPTTLHDAASPRTKVWTGKDGGLGEGRGNFSKLPLPSPSSSTSPTPANERPPP